MRRISLNDAAFLYFESRETPMHVGDVKLFTFPEGVKKPEYMAGLDRVFRSVDEFRRPFGECVVKGVLGPLGPLYWKEDQDLDFDYHVRHSALPKPGRYRELFALVSRLHGSLLDRSRPLWEVHLIEGLQNNRFAVYTKMHHATTDGIGSLHMTQSVSATRRGSRMKHSPFSKAASDAHAKSIEAPPPARIDLTAIELNTVLSVIRQQFELSGHLLGFLKRHVESWIGRGGGLAVPFRHVPRTTISSRVSGARRFVAQSWDMERVKSVGRALGMTVNDTVLAMCSGALRRYLQAQGELPRHSLRALVPVSVRSAGDYESANAVSFIIANLGTKFDAPGERVNAIVASTQAGKSLLAGLSSREATLYAGLMQSPTLLTSFLGLADRFPAYSTVISNVPGPRKPLFWNGAPMEGIYPLSAVFHGFALNITLVGYRGNLDFGITACRRSVPQVQRLIHDLEDSLTELERLV